MPDYTTPVANMLQIPDYSKGTNSLAQLQMSQAHSDLYKLQAYQQQLRQAGLAAYAADPTHNIQHLLNAGLTGEADQALKTGTIMQGQGQNAAASLGSYLETVRPEDRQEAARRKIGEWHKLGYVTREQGQAIFDDLKKGGTRSLTAQGPASVEESQRAPYQRQGEEARGNIAVRERAAGAAIEGAAGAAKAGTPMAPQTYTDIGRRAFSGPTQPMQSAVQPQAPQGPGPLESSDKSGNTFPPGVDQRVDALAAGQARFAPHQGKALTVVPPDNHTQDHISAEIPQITQGWGVDPKTGIVRQPSQAELKLSAESTDMLNKTYIPQADVAHQHSTELQNARTAIQSGAYTGPGRQGRENLAALVYGMQTAVGVDPTTAAKNAGRVSGVYLPLQELASKPLVRQGLEFARQTEGAVRSNAALNTGLSGSPSKDMTKEGVLKLIDTMHAENRWVEDRSKYAQEWANKNHTLNGFDVWWRQNHPEEAYASKANPLPWEDDPSKRMNGAYYQGAEGKKYIWNAENKQWIKAR